MIYIYIALYFVLGLLTVIICGRFDKHHGIKNNAEDEWFILLTIALVWPLALFIFSFVTLLCLIKRSLSTIPKTLTWLYNKGNK